jgi:hypothetical protein
MPDKKRKMPVFGMDVDVVDVPITKAVEHFNEYELEDGSALRVKSVATSIIRVEGQFTPDGKPVYIVLTGPVVSVVSSKLSPPESKLEDVKPVQ